MVGFFEVLLGVLFPWMLFLIIGRFGAAVIALILQATILGWIPASIWAIKTGLGDYRKKRQAQIKAAAEKAKVKQP